MAGAGGRCPILPFLPVSMRESLSSEASEQKFGVDYTSRISFSFFAEAASHSLIICRADPAALFQESLGRLP
jgi:hypothetical protein